MTKVQTFQEDCVELAKEKLARGEINRRQFAQAMAALGIVAAGGALTREAFAQAKELVYSNWGGTANQAYADYFGKPFMEKNPSVKVVMDAGSPTAGKIRAMVESKKVTWDVCDSSASTAILLGGQGFLEPIDYNLVKKNELIPGMAYTHGVAPYTFSNVLIYDKSKVGNDPPKGWVDFFNFQKYPGKRMMRRDANVMLESLAMGDGVPADKVNPLDQHVGRALDLLKKVRKDCVYWNSGAESEQLMRTGEAVMGVLWNTRAKVLFEETKGKLDFTWNQGIIQPGVNIIPKGNPAGALAQQFLAFVCTNVDGQIGLFNFFGNGPANVNASGKIPADKRRFNPSEPENLKQQIVYDGEWWGKNYPDVNQKYLDILAG